MRDVVATGSSSLDGLAQVDPILPERFHAEVRALRDPERRLRLAVLEDAIRYFQRYAGSTDGREQALYEDAVEWLSSRDRTEPYSFENVCDVLGLDADYVRGRLCRWRQAHGVGTSAASGPRVAAAPAGSDATQSGRHLRAA